MLAEPPSIIKSLPVATKVAEGETVTLPCSVVGTPRPTITWKTGATQSSPVYYGIHDRERFIIDSCGTLTIQVTLNIGTCSYRYSLFGSRYGEFKNMPLLCFASRLHCMYLKEHPLVTLQTISMQLVNAESYVWEISRRAK